jgi:4-hydroxybenzoate polyprenyltransferase
MKTLDYLKSFKDRILDGELTVKEAMSVFMILVVVASICIYAFAPQSFLQ